MTDTHRLSILYVGTLPPHQGGSAVSSGLIMGGLAKAGHRVRAVAPVTAEMIRAGDNFAACNQAMLVTRYVVPYFEIAPNNPTPVDYNINERSELLRILPKLLASERPDVIFAGRETFAHVVPAFARHHAIPCILRLAGGRTYGILSGAFDEAFTETLLDEFRLADLLVAPARHLHEKLAAFKFPPIRVIPNAVDLAAFAPSARNMTLFRELGAKDGDVLILHMSNLKEIKRPLDLVMSAEQALRRNPHLYYVIVGDGPLRQPLEAACRERLIRERFAFTGWVEHECVADYLNLADLVVMPSESEGQARVYLETQACGRTLLASDIASAREVVVHGKTGLLFRRGNIEDLTEKTLAAARDPQLRESIGRQARDRVGVHALDAVIAAYDAMLGEVVAASAQR
jgi:glycosyltransferase involved in cell wall biosynthesis